MTLTQDPVVAAATEDYTPLAPAFHHAPQQIAEDVFVIRQLQGEGHAPMSLYVNSLVIRGVEPVLVDTGTPNNRKQWLEDAFSIVDPKDVRWIYISHDDIDHIGNLAQVMEMCPKATLVVSWLMVERTSIEINLPLSRMRWVDDGEHFQAGDRTLIALRPPTYDAPTTRGLFDTKSGVYWASDSFGAPVPHHVDSAADLPVEAWSQGLTMFNRMLSPWTAIANPTKFADRVQAVRTLEAECIATCHGPVIGKKQLDTALELMAGLPEMGAVALPGQALLESMLAAITGSDG